MTSTAGIEAKQVARFLDVGHPCPRGSNSGWHRANEVLGSKARSSPLHNRSLECMASWRRARTHILKGSASDLVLPDGMPLVWLARWTGYALARCLYGVDGDVRRPC